LWQHFDHVFVSNFFEHLEDRHQLLAVLDFIARALKPGGTLLVIQPNFKYAYREYYDFVDHVLPVTDGSLSEALLATGFTIERMTPRFLPFTTKGRPASPALLRIYLALPILWRFFGGQLFAVARKR
jgi:SAM-dependent methyltransferase